MNKIKDIKERRDRVYKKKFGVFLVIFAMMIQILSLFPKIQVHAEEFLPNGVYYGTAVNTTAVLTYQGKEAKLMDPLWLNYPGHSNWSRIGYCINISKQFPKLNENVEYNGFKFDIEEAPTREIEFVGGKLEKPRHDKQKAVQQIRNALYRGFPLDGDGIQAKYDLTNDEFWHLTQMAIHFWSDSAYDGHLSPFTSAYTDYWNARPNKENLTKAYNDLISETGKTAPNDMMLLLFEPKQNNYQNMISADYQERKIEFSKVDDKGQPIGGVKFKIERKQSISKKLFVKEEAYDFYEFEVGSDGKISQVTKGEHFNNSLRMIWGDYTLTEVNTPIGYEGLTNPISFTIKSNGEILQEPKDSHISFKLDNHTNEPNQLLSKIWGATFTVTNFKKGYDFNFKKINESGQPLKDVEFKIYKGEDEVSNFTSSEKDFETVTLPQGDYTLKETSPPDGYSAMPDMTFNVDDNGKLTFTTTDYEKYITVDENKTSVTIKNYPNTIEKPKSNISTQVEVNNQKSTKDKSTVLKITGDTATIDFKDYLTYEKLFAGETYDIVALLCEVKDDGTVIEPTFATDLGKKITSKDFVANENGGVETIEFKNVEVKAGTKYVVMEMVTSRNKFPFDTGLAKHELSHKDKDDKAQTFIVEKIPTQSVTIEKKVTGASGDKQKEFTFNLKVNADEYLKNGDNLSGKLHKKDGQVSDVTITVGQNYSFSLKDGEHLELTGLFENSTYTLSETEYGKDGYTTTVMVNDTKKENADTDTTYTVVAGKNSVVFTNHNGKIVPTGILLDIMPYLVGIAFVGISGAVFLLVRKKKRNSIM